MTEIEKKRIEALKRVEAQYYDVESPHYKDNERYAWAVASINKAHNNRDIKET